MNVELHSTSQIVDLNGVPARVWEGQTDSGIPVHAFITRIAAPAEADQAEFERELQQHRPPIEVYPLRLIL